MHGVTMKISDHVLKVLTVTKKSAYFGDESKSEFLNVTKITEVHQ